MKGKFKQIPIEVSIKSNNDISKLDDIEIAQISDFPTFDVEIKGKMNYQTITIILSALGLFTFSNDELLKKYYEKHYKGFK